jgi:uncharacterized protein YjbI with pentapeptide repeats
MLAIVAYASYGTLGAPRQWGIMASSATGIRVVLGHFFGRQAKSLNISGRTTGNQVSSSCCRGFGGWVMVGRLLSVTGTALLIAVGLVTPVLATATAIPASAQTVIEGCTIVSNPTPTNFTNCSLMNLFDANFSGLNLSYANFANSTLAYCAGASCSAADFGAANLTDANLEGIGVADEFYATDPPEGADAEANFGDANLSGANLSGIALAANLGGANLTGADLSYTSMVATPTDLGIGVGAILTANLSGANFTDTILVPSNQSVTATNQTGAMATWTTPAALPGATTGSCTPASGSTFPIFSSTVTCQVFDATGGEATGTFEVNVVPTTQYFSRMLVPSNGATLSGANYLDAEASDAPGVAKVVFELSGGSLSNQVVATATPTIYGWLAQWASATVPNRSYSLVSVATDADGNTDTSTPISITVDNPMTSVLIPSAGAAVSGTSSVLNASASSAPGISSVVFELSGGTLSNQVIAKGTATYYGWLAEWNTTTVANGSYTLQSVATDNDGAQATSSPVSITVNNPAPTTTVLIPSKGATLSGTAAALDASASNATSVEFALFGGTYGLSGHLIGTATATIYGWLDSWNTTTVPNGSYVLVSVASGPGGSGFSTGVTVTVANPGLADLANSSFTVTGSDVVGGNGCSFVYGAIDAVYPGSAAVGNVTLHMAGCVTPSTFTGSFTITTGVGTLSGSAVGPIIEKEIGVDLVQIYEVTLSVNAATGSFAGATGDLLFSTSGQGNAASVAVE